MPQILPLLKLFRLTKCPEDFDLEKIQPDPDNSSICENEIRKDYDLQIIVPVYNVEKYIEECMDSIVGQQTQWRFVVTVVNDGSPDNSRNLLRKYEGLPYVEIIDQENRGFAGARNAALKHMRGEYIMFVDSDDVLEPGAVEALLTTAKRYDADIVQGSVRWFLGEKTLDFTSYTDAEHDSALYATPWGKVYRAELFRRTQFPENYWFEDVVLKFTVFELARRIRTVSNVVYNYRYHNSNISHSSKGLPKCLDLLWVLRRSLKDCRELGLIDRQTVYEKFLEQTKVGFCKAFTINDKRVWKAVFKELARLHKEYFSGRRSENEIWRPLEDALEKGDYEAYLKAVIRALVP